MGGEINFSCWWDLLCGGGDHREGEGEGDCDLFFRLTWCLKPLSNRSQSLCDCEEGLSHFWLWGWWRMICLLQCHHQGCDVYSRSLDRGVGCRTRAMTGGANNFSSKFLFCEPSSLVSWGKRSMFSCCPQVHVGVAP